MVAVAALTSYGNIPFWRFDSSTSSEDLPPFPYQPLGKHQIRLLEIEIVADRLIHCTIINVSLEDSPAYYALSYCWGTDVRNENFPISDHLFKITPNLLAALQALNGVMEKCDIRKYCIWVDAICIDQDNAAEKSIQVQQMDRIYRQADNVFIWLGGEADQSKKILMIFEWLSSDSETELEFLTKDLKINHNIEEKNLQALRSFIEELEKRRQQPFSQREPLQRVLQSDQFRDSLFKKDDPFWRDFVTFVNRPWFSRVWTYQELMLAQSTTVMCGNVILEWSSVYEPRRFLFHEDCFEKVYSMRNMELDYKELYRQMQSKILNVRPLEGEATFHKLLLEMRTRRAKEPRDFIFGMLGLVGGDIRSMISIDYDLSEASVFTNAVKIACGLPNGAAFFCQLLEECTITPKTQVKDLPTWCPDFSNGEWDVEAKCYTDPLIFDSALEAFKKFANVKCGQEDSIMSVVGMRLDRIEQSADVPPPNSSDFESLDSSLPQEAFIATCFGGATHTWLKQMREIFVSKDNQVSHPWLENYFFPKPQESVDSLHARFNEILRCCGQIQAQSIKTFDEIMDKLDISPAELQRIVMDTIQGSIRHGSKMFFLTASGRMGFSASPTRPGDNICLIPGGQYLQVLSSDCRRYISCASVEGLMGDSLLTRYEDWESQCETFHLE